MLLYYLCRIVWYATYPTFNNDASRPLDLPIKDIKWSKGLAFVLLYSLYPWFRYVAWPTHIKIDFDHLTHPTRSLNGSKAIYPLWSLMQYDIHLKKICSISRPPHSGRQMGPRSLDLLVSYTLKFNMQHHLFLKKKITLNVSLSH